MQYLGQGKKKDTAFRRNAQELLMEPKGFGLNWLQPYQFTADLKKKAQYTTGAWVSENWMAWMRLSKIFYLYYSVKNKASDDLTGHGDVLRMISSFTAVSAQAFTHSGIDDDDINNFNAMKGIPQLC